MKKMRFLPLAMTAMLLFSACSSDYTAPTASEDAAGEDAPTYGLYPGNKAEGETDEMPEPAGESYLDIRENAAKDTSEQSVMTFSLKVDTASYTNVQRYLESGIRPPKDAVRTEELINYFHYDAPVKNTSNSPFAVQTEIGPSPFDSDKHLVFARIKTAEIDKSELPPSNLVFLIDTSGSMDSYDKLPLLKEAFVLLVETLGENDTVSIVTYAGNSNIVLDSAHGLQKEQIINAINNLEAGGSTAGAQGIHTAYQLARKNFKKGANNRVILATDGDFNVGISNVDELAEFIGEKRDSGIYLSILGFGTGNTRDDIMETLSKNGNGNYSYINNVQSAQKILIEEMGSNLFTVADDVKAQIEFNPANVANYRLIGYENRRLNNEDFTDDTKDAGEIGAGTDVILMFEIELAGENSGNTDLKYTTSRTESEVRDNSSPQFGDELFELRIRYKDPGESSSKELLYPVKTDQLGQKTSSDFGFASAVAAFGHLLRESDYSGEISIATVRALAAKNIGDDKGGYRKAFLQLLDQYAELENTESRRG